MKKVVYENVTISKVSKDGYGLPKNATRTRASIRLFKLMGKCISDGGAVNMRTWYDSGFDGTEREMMDLTLEWPDSPLLEES